MREGVWEGGSEGGREWGGREGGREGVGREGGREGRGVFRGAFAPLELFSPPLNFQIF